jgi:hypothetical protein
VHVKKWRVTFNDRHVMWLWRLNWKLIYCGWKKFFEISKEGTDNFFFKFNFWEYLDWQECMNSRFYWERIFQEAYLHRCIDVLKFSLSISVFFSYKKQFLPNLFQYLGCQLKVKMTYWTLLIISNFYEHDL